MDSLCFVSDLCIREADLRFPWLPVGTYSWKFSTYNSCHIGFVWNYSVQTSIYRGGKSCFCHFSSYKYYKISVGRWIKSFKLFPLLRGGTAVPAVTHWILLRWLSVERRQRMFTMRAKQHDYKCETHSVTKFKYHKEFF